MGMMNPRLIAQDFADFDARRYKDFLRSAIKKNVASLSESDSKGTNKEILPPIDNSLTPREEVERQFGEQDDVKNHRIKCNRLVYPPVYVNGSNGPRAAEGVDLISNNDNCASDSPRALDETR